MPGRAACSAWAGQTVGVQAAMVPKRPLWKSVIACLISAGVFMTNGPCGDRLVGRLAAQDQQQGVAAAFRCDLIITPVKRDRLGFPGKDVAVHLHPALQHDDGDGIVLGRNRKLIADPVWRGSYYKRRGFSSWCISFLQRPGEPLRREKHKNATVLVIDGDTALACPENRTISALQDLNDLRYFVDVVEQNGYAAAARKLGMPRSRLSRRIGLLEERLGVRLIQRSTRHFAITEIGREFYRHCVAMTMEAEAAQEVIDRMRSEPQGLVHVSCPSSVIYFQTGEMIARFMAKHPKVAVSLESTNRRVDVIREGFDVAIRVRFPPLEEEGLVVRKLAESTQRLVANPAVLEGLPRPLTPADLGMLPSLAWEPAKEEHEWSLTGRDGTTAVIRHRPRFVTEDMVALRLAALRGVGVCQFPTMVVREDLKAGRLVDVLPDWAPRAGIIHATFPSRRGLLPSVRALLDFLAVEYASLSRTEDSKT